jgi:hypothetical protein
LELLPFVEEDIFVQDVHQGIAPGEEKINQMFFVSWIPLPPKTGLGNSRIPMTNNVADAWLNEGVGTTVQ